MVSAVVLKENGNQRFAFNIDANVGVNCPNKLDDVQLVQFGYFAKGQAPDTSPTLKALCAKVVPGAPYTGAPNDPLTLVIKAHQAERGGTQDGHVSVLPPNGATLSYDGKHSFMILVLNNNMLDITKNDYPRIDKHPSCPSVLKQRVRMLSIFE